MKKLATSILTLLLCAGILFCVVGCESKSSSSSNSKSDSTINTVYDMESFKTIKWPDSELGNILPEPKVNFLKGKINADKYDILSLAVKMYADEYENYVNLCKDHGFVKNYDKSDFSYYADNDYGYHLKLEYHKEDGSDVEHPLQRTLCIELTRGDNADSKSPTPTSSTIASTSTNPEPQSTTSELKEFNKSIKIDKTVLYNKNGLKITADRIAKTSEYQMTIFLTCANNSNKSVTFNAGSASDFDGRVALTVNGQEFNNFHAAEGAYIELEPGKSDEMKINLLISEAEEKGIYQVETIDLGISLITDENESGEYLHPLTLKVK